MQKADDHVGILVLDTGLVVKAWDNWLTRATGLPADSVRGRFVGEVFPDLAPRGMIARMQQVLTDGMPQILSPALHRHLLRCPPRSPSRYFDTMQQHVTIAPLRDGDVVVGLVIAIEDVTTLLEEDRDQARTGTQREAPDDALAAGTAAFRSGEWQERRAAVDAVGESDAPGLAARLLTMIRREYGNLNVLNSALQALVVVDVDGLAPLIELLQDTDPSLRTYAALALGSRRDRRAAPALIDALYDSDPNVSYHAIEALGRLRATEAVDALLQVAESGEFFLAFPALDALAEIGEAHVAPHLVPLLGDELLRAPAASALGQLGDEEVVAPLVALLNTTGAPANVVAAALAALYDRYEKLFREGQYIADRVRAQISPAGMQNLLDGLAAAGSDDVRNLALVVGWLEDPAVDRALARLLGWPSARREVVEALVRHGSRVTQLLVVQLSADDLETRQAAAIALGRIGDPEAVPELTRVMLADPELTVLAAGALAKIGDRRPYEALLGLLGHESVTVRQAAIAALNSLGHPDLACRMADLLQSPNPHLRESAVRIAGYFGFAQCTDLLFAACEDEDERVRRAAIEHAPYVEDERVLPILERALHAAEPRERAAAARALGQVATGRAVPGLLEALADEDPWVRYGAARSLGLHGAPEALEPLVEVIHADPAPHVRAAAIEALGQLGGARAVAALAPLLDGDDADLASAALSALGSISHPDAEHPLLAALESGQPALRARAAAALGHRGGSAAAPALQWAAAADSSFDVIEAAISGLGHLGTPEAITALIALTVDPARRVLAVTALAELGHEEQIALLGQGLDHSQPGVRRATVDALARMKRPEASDILIEALDHADPVVRAAAAEALGRLGNRRAERRLVVLAAADSDPAVRRAAHKALHR